MTTSRITSHQTPANSIFAKHLMWKLMSSLLILLIFSNSLQATTDGYPSSYTPTELLKALLDGDYHPDLHAVIWDATPADIHEFNGQLGENSKLYSFVDTTMIIDRGSEEIYYTIFRTAPMINIEEGKFENANSCHVCGVNLGYFSYTKEGDSIYVTTFKRNFAVHGSFGEKTYALSMINLGDGYELLKVDDPYQGMGITSVATKFYYEGELMLSMISEENNLGNREKDQNGYYEFKTNYDYDPTKDTLFIKQIGYKIDERSGKKTKTDKTKKLLLDSYTLQF